MAEKPDLKALVKAFTSDVPGRAMTRKLPAMQKLAETRGRELRAAVAAVQKSLGMSQAQAIRTLVTISKSKKIRQAVGLEPTARPRPTPKRTPTPPARPKPRGTPTPPRR